MFPLHDSQPTRRFPFINYLLIITTIIVFFIQISAYDFENFVYQYGFVPARFSFLDLNSYRYIFYSLFLHGGWFHLLSNMWFLHIFGDNVEDRFGHLRYLGFYLAAGFFAAFFQLIFNLGSDIPMIGASGAISGVVGAYFVFLKNQKSRQLSLLFLVFMISLSCQLGFFWVTGLLFKFFPALARWLPLIFNKEELPGLLILVVLFLDI